MRSRMGDLLCRLAFEELSECVDIPYLSFRPVRTHFRHCDDTMDFRFARRGVSAPSGLPVTRPSFGKSLA